MSTASTGPQVSHIRSFPHHSRDLTSANAFMRSPLEFALVPVVRPARNHSRPSSKLYLARGLRVEAKEN
jgi:hypothetical protein